jgi:hypothetical protein
VQKNKDWIKLAKNLNQLAIITLPVLINAGGVRNKKYIQNFSRKLVRKITFRTTRI